MFSVTSCPSNDICADVNRLNRSIIFAEQRAAAASLYQLLAVHPPTEDPSCATVQLMWRELVTDEQSLQEDESGKDCADISQLFPCSV